MDKARRDALCACEGSTLKLFYEKIFASVGLAALGVSTLHAQYSPTVTAAELANPVVGGGHACASFYDDNYLTLPNAAQHLRQGGQPSAR